MTAIVLLLWVGGPIFNAAPLLVLRTVKSFMTGSVAGGFGWVWLEFQALMYLFFFLAHGLLHEPSARGIPGGEPVPI